MDGRPSFELGRPIEGASQPNSDASEPTKTGPSIDHRPQPRVPIGPGSIAFPAMQASDAHKERLAIARRHQGWARAPPTTARASTRAAKFETCCCTWRANKPLKRYLN